jgi:hypothetical protein
VVGGGAAGGGGGGAGATGGGGGGTVVGADATGGGDGGTMVGVGEVTDGVVAAGAFAGAVPRGAVVIGEPAPFPWLAGTPLPIAAREPEVSANPTLIPAAATRAMTAKMIPSRFVMGGSFDSGACIREPTSAPGLGL